MVLHLYGDSDIAYHVSDQYEACFLCTFDMSTTILNPKLTVEKLQLELVHHKHLSLFSCSYLASVVLKDTGREV